MLPKRQSLWIRVLKKLWFLCLHKDESYFWTRENLVSPSTTNINAASSYVRPMGEIFNFWGSLHTKLIKDQAQRQVSHQGGAEQVTFNHGWERALSYLTCFLCQLWPSTPLRVHRDSFTNSVNAKSVQLHFPWCWHHLTSVLSFTYTSIFIITRSRRHGMTGSRRCLVLQKQGLEKSYFCAISVI